KTGSWTPRYSIQSPPGPPVRPWRRVPYTPQTAHTGLGTAPLAGRGPTHPGSRSQTAPPPRSGRTGGRGWPSRRSTGPPPLGGAPGGWPPAGAGPPGQRRTAAWFLDGALGAVAGRSWGRPPFQQGFPVHFSVLIEGEGLTGAEHRGHHVTGQLLGQGLAH